MQQVQLVGITPEDNATLIQERFEKSLQKITQYLQPKEPVEYLTREEVSQLLKINLSTLYHWTKSGKLISYGIGNRVYYKRSEIEVALKPLKG